MNDSLYDRFTCPFLDKNWHYQARKIYDEINKTSSESLKKILKSDLHEILCNRKEKT